MRVLLTIAFLAAASAAAAQYPNPYGGGGYANPYRSKPKTYGFGYPAPPPPDPVRMGRGYQYYSNPWNFSREMEAYNRWRQPFDELDRRYREAVPPRQRVYIYNR